MPTLFTTTTATVATDTLTTVARCREYLSITTSGRDPDDYFGAGLELGGLLGATFGAIPAECKA